MNDRIRHLKEHRSVKRQGSGILPADVISRVYRESDTRSIAKKRAVSLKTVLEETEVTADPEDLIFGTFSAQNCAGIICPGGNLPDDVCPDAVKWLTVGPAAMRQIIKSRLYLGRNESREFYECVLLVLDGVITYMHRYAKLADRLSAEHPEYSDTLRMICENCRNLASRPAQTYWEALQSLWFLFTVLRYENGTPAFSAGRLDRYLYRYYRDDIRHGVMTEEQGRELTECLWLKLSETQFSVTAGGITENGEPVCNELTRLFCQIQADPELPGPTLYLRVNGNTEEQLIPTAESASACTVLHDEEIIPRMQGEFGFSEADARNYAVSGTGELCGSGNSVVWSDAGNIGLSSFAGSSEDFRKMADECADRIVTAHRNAESVFREELPAALLSAVTDNCLETGTDASFGSVRHRFAVVRIQNADDERIGSVVSALKERFGAEGIRAVVHP